MWRTWMMPLAMVVLAGVVFGGSDVVGVVTGLILVVVAWIYSPLFFPRHVDDAEARREALQRGVPVVYWRPGCVFCIRLRATLRASAGRAVWVNIWRDPDAAARVREVNGGNETVPTVFVGDAAHTNPDPKWLGEQLRR